MPIGDTTNTLITEPHAAIRPSIHHGDEAVKFCLIERRMPQQVQTGFQNVYLCLGQRSCSDGHRFPPSSYQVCLP